MRKLSFSILLIVGILLFPFNVYDLQNIQDAEIENCKWQDFNLYGKVQIVESFPDIKVQLTEHFPDIKVKYVQAFPDECGEWQLVEQFPDFKVQIVDHFPDIKIKIVDHFPGVD